jgi:uncharacterized membrane protein (DUF4010 family)
MGERAKETPTFIGVAVAGAILSCIATHNAARCNPPAYIKCACVATRFGGISVAIYGLMLTLDSFHKNEAKFNNPTKMFSVKTALILAAVISVVLITSAALKAWFGQVGLIAGSGMAGLADARAATISVASLAAAGKLSPVNTVMPILVAFSINAISKAVMATISGGKDFARLVIPGLIVQVAATWAGWWFF